MGTEVLEWSLGHMEMFVSWLCDHPGDESLGHNRERRGGWMISWREGVD